MQRILLEKNNFWSKQFSSGELKENESIKISGQDYILKSGILRSKSIYSQNQSQTKKAFGFKWNKRNTYESGQVQRHSRNWLIQKYLGGRTELLKKWLRPGVLLLDAGCGSGFSSLLLFGKRLNDANYLGVDISEAVDTAKIRFKEKGIKGEFMQTDLLRLPFSKPIFDLIFSEGVLHHTDCPEKTFRVLTKLIKPGGRFLFYVYRKKAPIREFVDDYLRNYLKDLDNGTAWKELMALTKLGKTLGDLKISIDIPKAIPYFGIPSGKIDLQRFFYWYIFKAFYRPEFKLSEMNHINFDWYRPLNCHRFSSPEVKNWCRKSGLLIERLCEEEAGISVVARKRR
jgi:SAM-dependent methyltransferase